MSSAPGQRNALHAIAAFEATKGTAALAGGIYIPFELIHFIHEPSVVNAGVVLLNAAIVAYLARALWQRHPLSTPPHD